MNTSRGDEVLHACVRNDGYPSSPLRPQCTLMITRPKHDTPSIYLMATRSKLEFMQLLMYSLRMPCIVAHAA